MDYELQDMRPIGIAHRKKRRNVVKKDCRIRQQRTEDAADRSGLTYRKLTIKDIGYNPIPLILISSNMLNYTCKDRERLIECFFPVLAMLGCP